LRSADRGLTLSAVITTYLRFARLQSDVSAVSRVKPVRGVPGTRPGRDHRSGGTPPLDFACRKIWLSLRCIVKWVLVAHRAVMHSDKASDPLGGGSRGLVARLAQHAWRLAASVTAKTQRNEGRDARRTTDLGEDRGSAASREAVELPHIPMVRFAGDGL
jgi:hypothetical protein